MDAQPRKKFINHPDSVVSDALRGLVACDQSICFHPHNPRIVLRKDYDQIKATQVTIVCGGGSGHEPFAAGYVGINGLTAAVCGDLFASPPSSHVSDAVRAVNGLQGTLLLVINYTGDRLNFGMAVERLTAANIQTNVRLVYVDEDVALEGRSGGVGSRGLAGAALVLHILGVVVEQQGIDYEQASNCANTLIGNIGTFGVSLYPCAIPGKAAMFQLAADEMEFGLGIHGESGLERCAMQTANQIVNTMLTKLVNSTRLHLAKEDKVVILLNNLGGVSQLEMGVVQAEVMDWMVKNGFKVERMIVGTLMSSLNSHGLSLTILKVVDSRWLNFLDTNSAISNNWKITSPCSGQTKLSHLPKSQKDCEHGSLGVEVQKATAIKIEHCLAKACKVISENEEELNFLDGRCGDGDCGTSLNSAAKAIQTAIQDNQLDFNHPKRLFLQLSYMFEESIGGTSGALYALLLGAASKAFEESAESKDFKRALQLGLEAVVYYGHARPGHRTMVDPLNAAVEQQSDDWHLILQRVEQAAIDTIKMQAKSGRASYTSSQQQQEPDPGARAVAIWFRAIYEECFK